MQKDSCCAQATMQSVNAFSRETLAASPSCQAGRNKVYKKRKKWRKKKRNFQTFFFILCLFEGKTRAASERGMSFRMLPLLYVTAMMYALAMVSVIIVVKPHNDNHWREHRKDQVDCCQSYFYYWPKKRDQARKCWIRHGLKPCNQEEFALRSDEININHKQNEDTCYFYIPILKWKWSRTNKKPKSYVKSTTCFCLRTAIMKVPFSKGTTFSSFICLTLAKFCSDEKENQRSLSLTLCIMICFQAFHEDLEPPKVGGEGKRGKRQEKRRDET